MSWLFAAFLVAWLIFFFYLLSLARKQKAISNEIASLKARIGERTR